jgi:hypothetical protein
MSAFAYWILVTNEAGVAGIRGNTNWHPHAGGAGGTGEEPDG